MITLTNIRIQRIKTNNPVRIVPNEDPSMAHKGSLLVINEGDEVLYRASRRDRCYRWCRKNRCQPVQADWDTLEERWTILKWLPIKPPRFYSDAVKTYVSMNGKYLLVLWNHAQAQGWHVYIRHDPGSVNPYTFFANAWKESLGWRMNEVYYWAELTLWQGMDRPDGNTKSDVALQFQFDTAHSAL